ncbi:MAG: hypothetical protein ACJ763_06945 [Bdellovibrionia bacterium]
MKSTKYLAATGAMLAITGAIWLYSGEKKAEVAPLRSSSNGAGSLGAEATLTSAASPLPSSSPMVIEAMNPTPQDLQHIKVLDEVLAAKNDNDPRLDSEFRGLSPTSKRMMEDRYRSLPPEKRNERGTIAFLVGREIASADDVAFMGGILSEPPCLSLGDCSREDKNTDDAHLNAETGAAVSLAYPQLVALHSIEGQIERAEKGAKLGYLGDIRHVIDEAIRSPIPNVADKARALQTRLKSLSG